MRFLDRLIRGSTPPSLLPHLGTRVAPTTVSARRAQVSLYGGHETLEVVGESHYQAELWQIVGQAHDRHDPVRFDAIAVLVPEPENPYDEHAVRVEIGGLLVGYLSRSDALRYQPGILQLLRGTGSLVALRGQVVGRGGADGIGLLGVFLDHDPADFGLPSSHVGELRTGLREAAHSWWGNLSGETLHDVAALRKLLKTEQRPLDRHYMWATLERLIYRSRDTFASAITEYDDVCEQHHAEMASIRPALIGEFGGIPLIELYRQQAIRWKKSHEWDRVIDWAERGLLVYDADACRPDDVTDLRERVAYARAKLQPAAPRTQRRSPTPAVSPLQNLEVLICTQCGAQFERERTRGRKPHLCPACRG